jgi:PAS domain S-box-containing protein
MKLTPKLALIFISFAAAILVGVGLLVYSSGRTALEAATITELESISLEKSAALDTWVAGHKAHITALSHSPVLLEELVTFLGSDLNRNFAHDRLVRELSVHTGPGQPYLAFFILSPDTGEILVATNPREEGKFREDRAYFLQGKTAPFVSKVYYSLELQSPAITASAPLRAENGQLLGVLAGRLNLEDLNTIIQRRSGLRRTDDAFLVNTSNLFVTQPHLLPDPAVLQRGIHTQAVRQCLQTRSRGTISTLDYQDVPAIIVFRWLPEQEMCLIVKMDQAEALAPVQAFGRAIGWIALITLAVASVVALTLSHTITRPILAIQSVVQQYGFGNLDTRLPEKRPDELGVLAHEFNQMAERLAEKDLQLREYAHTLEQKVQERTNALQQSMSQLQRAEATGGIGSWEWLIPENQVIWSDGLYKIFGLEPQEFGATYQAYMEQVHPDDREVVHQVVEEAFQAGGVFEYECRVLRKDGKIRYLYSKGEVLSEEHGSPARMFGVAIDITERRQAEQALRESEDKFKYIFDHSIIGKSITFPNGRLTVNKAFCDMLGYSEGELKSRTWQEITHPDDIEVSSTVIASILAGERDSIRFTKRYLSKDGSVVWADVSTVLRRDAEGRPEYFMTALVDITERIQAEAALRESEERYRSLFQNMISGYAYCQMLFDQNDQAEDFIYLNVNEAFERLTGLRNVVGKKVSEVIPGIQQSNPELFEVYGRAARTGQSERFETHIDSLGVWFSVSVYSPKQGYFVAVFDNITERKQAEAALRLENERFLRFVDSNIVGIAIADAGGGIVLANDYYLNILGVTRADFAAGRVDWRKLTPPEWLPADEKAIRELRQRGVCEPYEKEYLRADGTRVPVYLADAMLPGEREQIAAFILDITDRKRAEEAIQRITDDLLRSNAELEQFAYVASHDLQEPLRMISSYVQLLAKRYQGKLDSDADEFIAFAVDGATRMQNLINDLLAYSRVGTRGNPFTAVSAEYLLEEALANLQLTIAESQAQITHDPLPVVKGDPVQLVAVFQNLLGNAIKFRGAEPLCIHIHARQQEQEWIFSVRDNGIGFDPRFAERIFVIFQRLNDRTEYPGTGIGLSICKRVITRHGGRIWVESEPGKGSVFYFTLPALGS